MATVQLTGKAVTLTLAFSAAVINLDSDADIEPAWDTLLTIDTIGGGMLCSCSFLSNMKWRVAVFA
jgi:hypothetical protein